MVAPSGAHAYENRVDINLSEGSGEAKVFGLEADIEMGGYGLGYTRFLAPIETDGDTPYGVREFLQHPSKIKVAHTATGTEADIEGIPEKYEVEKAEVLVGGSYNVDIGEKDIVLSLYLKSHASSDKLAMLWEDETTGWALIIGFEKYLAPDVSVGVQLENGHYETEFKLSGGPDEKYSEGALAFGASALIDEHFWLSGGFWGGSREERDSEWETTWGGLSLTAGVYVSQKAGLFATISSESEEREEAGITTENEMGTLELVGEFYFSGSSRLSAALGFMHLETDGGDEVDSSLLTIAYGQYF